MIDRPLDISTLRKIAALKAWNAYRRPEDPADVPLAFYYAVDLVIADCYSNIQKMVNESIKERLDAIYKK